MADLEQRLHTVLSAQADKVDSDLSGPAVRAIAEQRTRTGRRTAAQALVAAAAIAVIGIVPRVLTGPEQHRPAPRPIAPGARVSLPAASTPTATPTAPRSPASQRRHDSTAPGPQPRSSAAPATSAVIPTRRPRASRPVAPALRSPVTGYRPPAPPRQTAETATQSP